MKKRANKVRGLAAESVERRASAARNPGIHAMAGTQRPAELDVGSAWVREAATWDRSLRFNNLLHHMTVPRLELAYRSLRKDAASGVDEQDWASYGVGLAERLVRVHQLVQSGRYQPQPVLRQWALKPDGRKRPLGVTCVEDKVVQKALAGVLEAIFEVDFRCTWMCECRGRRMRKSGRGSAMAFVRVAVSTMRWTRCTWRSPRGRSAGCWMRILKRVLTALSTATLLAVLGRRIADRRVLRLIEQMLRAGVVDDGKWQPSMVGVPQGAVISPLLANVFLHDACHRWVNGWRGRLSTRNGVHRSLCGRLRHWHAISQ